MTHGHLFRNHTPRAQQLIKTRTRHPASQRFGASIVAIHKAQGVVVHPKNRRLPPTLPQCDRLGHGAGRHGPSGFLVVKIGRTSDHPEAPPPVVIQIRNQPPIRLLIDRLRAAPISRIAGRDEGKARVTNFFGSDRALKLSGSIGGVHGVSLRMAQKISSGPAAGFIGGEGRAGWSSDARFRHEPTTFGFFSLHPNPERKPRHRNELCPRDLYSVRARILRNPKRLEVSQSQREEIETPMPLKGSENRDSKMRKPKPR